MPPSAPPLLVVEDDPTVRALIADVLEALDYTVIVAQDGEAALKILQDPNQALALMMTDIGLPGMSGNELASKAREARPLLPILFASGLGDSSEIPNGMYMISKPFGIDTLRDKVKHILAAVETDNSL
ncbi:response regulator [Pseudomonas auratipiscis]|uniref:Response regulator n=1 Tax=Pseudomonas auratipiscis TaxID=3115853 RepID=A0AB35WRK4_9PSED|nr:MULTISPECIES: response regulator [unclassified Pseudomonas]MEE1865760.1 response regulator [Pseudomonas sp. 120P]MEE1957071.1 response regulator [Pseudomonas sp. 119P]